MAFSANQSKKNYECTITVYRSCVGLSTDEAEEKGLQRTINVDIQTESEFLRLCLLFLFNIPGGIWIFVKGFRENL